MSMRLCHCGFALFLVIGIALSSRTEAESMRWRWQNANIDLQPSLQKFVLSQSGGSVYLADASSLKQIDIQHAVVNADFFLPESSVIDIVSSLSDNQETLWILSPNSLYRFNSQPKNWQKIYQTSDDDEFYRDLESFHHHVFIASSSGLLLFDQQKSLISQVTGSRNKNIFQIDKNSTGLFFTTDHEFYQYDPLSSKMNLLFSVSRSESDEETIQSKIFDFSILHNQIILSTSDGIFLSNDSGQNWKSLSFLYGFSDSITRLEWLDSDRFVMTSETAHYIIDASQQTKHFIPFEDHKNLLDLSRDSSGQIWGYSKNHVYKLINQKSFHSKNVIPTENIFENDPSIQDVQFATMSYADVHPEKIHRWKKQARQKALLPDLSIGFDRAASDLYHWNTGANPDELQKGAEYVDWDVSLSWDLGDLIWSTDQTSIDSRAKLMTELREDLLNQVTRLYFERKRIVWKLHHELFEDPRLEFEKRLRLEELTAFLDALTGGWFSRQL